MRLRLYIFLPEGVTEGPAHLPCTMAPAANASIVPAVAAKRPATVCQ